MSDVYFLTYYDLAFSSINFRDPLVFDIGEGYLNKITLKAKPGQEYGTQVVEASFAVPFEAIDGDCFNQIHQNAISGEGKNHRFWYPDKNGKLVRRSPSIDSSLFPTSFKSKFEGITKKLELEENVAI